METATTARTQTQAGGSGSPCRANSMRLISASAARERHDAREQLGMSQPTERSPSHRVAMAQTMVAPDSPTHTQFAPSRMMTADSLVAFSVSVPLSSASV